MTELAGENRVEVEACIASFEPATFDPSSVVGIFRDDSDDERRRLLRLVSTVIEADDEIDLAVARKFKRGFTTVVLARAEGTWWVGHLGSMSLEVVRDHRILDVSP